MKQACSQILAQYYLITIANVRVVLAHGSIEGKHEIAITASLVTVVWAPSSVGRIVDAVLTAVVVIDF